MATDRQRHIQQDGMDDPISEYWQRYAQAFASPLAADGLLGGFVANPSVTGAYAEAAIRKIVETMVPGLCVSTGAVVRTSDVVKGKDLRTVPQCDLILWDPTELPPLFRNGEFALVHAQAARAILEVKRSVSDLAEFNNQLKRQRQRLFPEFRRNVLGVVISASKPLTPANVQPGWVDKVDPAGEEVPKTRLLSRKDSKADVDGLFALVYFLSSVARQQRRQS